MDSPLSVLYTQSHMEPELIESDFAFQSQMTKSVHLEINDAHILFD